MPSVAAPKAAEAEAPKRPAPAPLDAASKAALARARKLQAEGNLHEAKAEFLRAAGNAPPLNLQPLVELAYLQMNDPASSNEEALAFLRAGTGSGDPSLEAQAWYNLALLHARSGDAEAERAALSRSLARRENKAARAKLQGRSSCVAEVRKEAPLTAQVVTGWTEVCRHLGRCDAAPSSANEARELACVTAQGADQTDTHGCQGAGPWDSSWNYLWFAYQTGFIAPLAGDRFFVATGRGGGWQARCNRALWPAWSQQGSYVLATFDESQLEPFPGRPVPLEDPEHGACLESPGPTTSAFFAAGTAKLLGVISVPSDHGVTVRLEPAAQRVIVTGGGCSGYVPLDGSLRLLAL